MTTRFLTLLAAALLAARPAAADNCNFDIADGWFRLRVHNYTTSVDREGYSKVQMAWNDNNVDDDPSQGEYDSIEGPDCSGLVAKAWHLPDQAGANGCAYWPAGRNIRPGGYTSYQFFHLQGPWFEIPDGSGAIADAYVRRDSVQHVGLLYTNDRNANGESLVVESRNGVDGSDVHWKAVVGRGWKWISRAMPGCG